MGVIASIALLSTFVASNAFAVGGITMTDISTSIHPIHVGNTFKINAKISNHSNHDIHFGECALTVTIKNAQILPRVCHHILITLHPGGSHILSTSPLKAIKSGPTEAHVTFIPSHISKVLRFTILP